MLWRPKSPSLLIFDWDGTLVDSIGRIVHCFLETYSRLGLDSPPLAAIRKTIGLPLREGFRHLKVGLEDPGLDVLAEIYRDLWLDPQLAVSPLFPGVLELLEKLTSAGHLLAVATGKSRVGLDRESRTHNVNHFFCSTVCGDESQPKPNPDMIFQILRETATQPSAAILLGDSPLDLAMANNAKIAAMGVLTGAGDRASLIAHQPIACLDHIGQVSEWVFR